MDETFPQNQQIYLPELQDQEAPKPESGSEKFATVSLELFLSNVALYRYILQSFILIQHTLFIINLSIYIYSFVELTIK